jgi:hypothetical protein
MIRPPELSGNSASRALVSKQRNWENEIMNFSLPRIFDRISKGYLTRRKILRHGTSGFTYLPRGRCAEDFYRP